MVYIIISLQCCNTCFAEAAVTAACAQKCLKQTPKPCYATGLASVVSCLTVLATREWRELQCMCKIIFLLCTFTGLTSPAVSYIFDLLPTVKCLSDMFLIILSPHPPGIWLLQWLIVKSVLVGGKDPEFSLTEIRSFAIYWTKGINKSFFISASHLGSCKCHSAASSSSVTSLAVAGRGEKQLRLRLERAQVRASLGLRGRRFWAESGTWECCHQRVLGDSSGRWAELL